MGLCVVIFLAAPATIFTLDSGRTACVDSKALSTLLVLILVPSH